MMKLTIQGKHTLNLVGVDYEIYLGVELIFGLDLSVDVVVARLNAAEMLVDVAQSEWGTETHWIAESGVLDLFLMLGPSPTEVSLSQKMCNLVSH